MKECGNCGNCTGCSGCGALELNPGEMEFLRKLGQIPFLPVARRTDSEIPVFLEDGESVMDECSLILRCLEKKGLISIDYDQPLKGWDYSAYKDCQIHGSIALTARGQRTLETLEIEGYLE